MQIDSSALPGDDPLNNLGGGFIYKRAITNDFVYKTGCDKFVLGINVNSDMCYMGVQWCYENDNPTCPDNDPLLHGVLGGGLCIQCQCVCHKTDEIYNYENSIEKADDERDAKKKQKNNDYSNAHQGRICANHMFFNERTREWRLDYTPNGCAKICYSQNSYCPILGRQLNRKKGFPPTRI